MFPWLTNSAKQHRIQDLAYESVDINLNAIKAVLQEGYPVWIGFVVYDSFESSEVAKTGMVPMPGKDESILGGHSVLIIGYNDSTQRFKVRNSWGTGWGDKGNCYFNYAYLTNPDLAMDYWVVRKIS